MRGRGQSCVQPAHGSEGFPGGERLLSASEFLLSFFFGTCTCSWDHRESRKQHGLDLPPHLPTEVQSFFPKHRKVGRNWRSLWTRFMPRTRGGQRTARPTCILHQRQRGGRICSRPNPNAWRIIFICVLFYTKDSDGLGVAGSPDFRQGPVHYWPSDTCGWFLCPHPPAPAPTHILLSKPRLASAKPVPGSASPRSICCQGPRTLQVGKASFPGLPCAHGGSCPF